MGRVVIIANGTIRNDEFHRNLIRSDDYLICVDGGIRHAARLGLRPQLLIGDLDSLDDDLRAWLVGGQTRCETHPAEKDFTDAHLAVDKALRMRPDEILLLGCLGGRLDHTLANLSLLLQCHRAGVPARLVDELNEVTLISGETIRLQGRPGERISLLPLSDHVSGITIRGTKYQLDNGALERGESRGVSNEFVGPEATISVSRGYLLVIKSRGA
ncbi:MAG: thiamine diphosphokinase [Deltaproteobacteria bacterium]|nr:thiamine diphosphokinase [Deltaproteobacteria bacterium]